MSFFSDEIVSKIKLIQTLAEDPETEKVAGEAFDHFKLGEKDGIDFSHFEFLLKELFVDTKTGESLEFPKSWATEFFQKFDSNGDGLIDRQEFVDMWLKWLQVVLKPRTGLIVVDVQNEFIDGSLALRDGPSGDEGRDVIPVINSLIKGLPFDLIVYTLDWHREDHISYYVNYRKRTIIHPDGTPLTDRELDAIRPLDKVTFEGPPKTLQILWPVHCVEGSWGAELHPDLLIREEASVKVFKGYDSRVHAYSAFWDDEKTSETSLHQELVSRGITDVFVCGIAYDYCVGSTALHALEYGFRTTLVTDSTRGIDYKTIADMKKRLEDAGCFFADSEQVMGMAGGRVRRPELAYQVLKSLK